jgi:hypothetical protein
MGVAIGRPVRGPLAADSRIRPILLAAAQSPSSPLRGCSLDDALSSRCFKRWQLNKNCSERPPVFPSFPIPTTWERRLRSANILVFSSLARDARLRMTRRKHGPESAPNKYSLAVAHEMYRRSPAVLEFPTMRTGGRLGGEQILILGSTGPSRLVEFADLIHCARQAYDESISWHAS